MYLSIYTGLYTNLTKVGRMKRIFLFPFLNGFGFPIFLAQITKLGKKIRDFSFRAMGWTWFKVYY